MPDPLKDTLFDTAFFDALCAALAAAYPPFDSARFLAQVFDDGWQTLELKQRVRRVALTLHEVLPEDYRTALDILCRAAEQMPRGHFGAMAFPDYVALYGLEDWEASIPALAVFTQLISSEYAVRPFILRDPARMMAQMLAWARDENEHMRRLASEGCRPRLPWSIALPIFKVDPGPILPVLEALKEDPSEYVRRSVANNLNDIAKDNPGVVIDVLRRWRAIETDEMRWLISHALRTLVKQGHPDALALLGYSDGAAVAVENLCVTPEQVPLGGTLTFAFDIVSQADAPQDLMIDYVMYFMRASGQQTAKVFKLTRRTLAPGETVSIRRTFSFKPITTRRYYPGAHVVEVQVNGAACGRCAFMLVQTL